MNFSHPDKAGIGERNWNIRIPPKQRFNTGPVILNLHSYFENAASTERNNFGWTGFVDFFHEKTSFCNDSFAASKWGLTLTEESNGPIVVRIVF